MLKRARFSLASTCSLVALTLMVAGAAAPARAQTFYTVPALGGDAASNLTAMTADGSAVTGQSVAANNTVTPFTWTVAGNTTTAFTTTSGATNVSPTAINNSGNETLVIGSAISSIGPIVPFIYNGTAFLQMNITGTAPSAAGARAVALGNPNPGNETLPLVVNGFTGSNAISGNLFIANLTTGNLGANITPSRAGGYAGVSSNGLRLAYLDTANNTAAIFDRGGPASFPAPAFGNVTSGNITGNFVATVIHGISSDGGFVYGVANTSIFANTYQRGFIFDSTANTSTIVPPLASTDTFGTIHAVSIAGIGVGASGTSSSFANETAVLFDPALGTFGLKHLLESAVYGLDLSAWSSLNEARAISDDGLTIAGVGNLSGNRTGFVVVLPALPAEYTELIIIDQPISQTASVQSNVTFSVSALPGTDGGDLSYQWNFEASPIANATGQSLNLLKVEAANAGNYTVTVSNATTNVTSNIATLTVTGNPPADPGFYTVAPLGGGHETVITAMSPDGQLVAGQEIANNTPSPIIWSLRANATTAFADNGGATSILPSDISNAGPVPLIVGSATNSTSATVPFLYNSANLLLLSTNGSTGARATGLADPTDTSALLAINGINGTTISGGNLFSTDLTTGAYATAASTRAGGIFGISENGNAFAFIQGTGGNRVAGAFYRNLSQNLTATPFGTQTSGAVTGAFSTEAVGGISANGLYVFGTANTTVPGQTYHRGYIFNPIGGSVTLLAPNHPADVFGACLAVSDDGVGVGLSGVGAGNTAALGNETAVVYHPTLGTLGLQNVLTKVYNMDVGNLTLNEARSISADGKVIAGVGLDGSTRTGFVALLPSSISNISVANLTIIEDPVNQSPFINANVTFSVTALAGNTSGGNLTYQWYKNGTPIAGATSSDLVLNKVQTSGNGTYTVSVSDGLTSANSTAATLGVVNNLPIIDTQPKAVSNIQIGKSLTLSVVAEPSTVVSYQWYFANSTTSFFITGATNPTYTASNVTLNMDGNYTVQLTNGNGTSTSNIARVHILYPPKVTTQPVAKTIKPGQLLKLVVVATGYPAPKYQWYQNNRVVTKKTGKDAIYQVKPAHQPDSGKYRVKVSNSQGFVYSKWVQVTVAPKTGNTTTGNTTTGG